MRKYRLILFFILVTNVSIYSQVGINTENPHTMLDVNGDLQIRGELRAGTDTDDEVAAGKAGQILMSQGAGLPPKWGDLELPDYITGEYLLTDTRFAEDRTGIIINTVGNSSMTEGSTYDSQWQVIEGMTTNISVSKSKNRIMFTTQTVIQSPYEGVLTLDTSWGRIYCAIFIGLKDEDRSGFKLVAVREGYISGGHYPQLALSLISSYDNLAVGDYEIIVAFQRKAGADTILNLPTYVGRGFDTSKAVQVSNNFMNKSVIRVDVFEPEN